MATSSPGGRAHLQNFSDFASARRTALIGTLLHVGDEVRALRILLHAGEHHLRADDVLLRVHEILVQMLVAPDDPRRLVRIAVGVEVRGAALAAEEAPEGRALLGRA